MAKDALLHIVTQLSGLPDRQKGPAETDGQLLRRFLAREEWAFEELVHRHGCMVFGVCRRLLSHFQDSEDAFQATFLVLASKANSLVSHATVGGWLYGVAHNISIKARAAKGKLPVSGRQMGVVPDRHSSSSDEQHDWLPLLDKEIRHLPGKYRVPVILCDMEGKSRKEAALLLNCKEGTLSGRLARARSMLAKRLVQKGWKGTGLAIIAALSYDASLSAVSPALTKSTVKIAMLVLSGSGLSSVTIPVQVTLLSKGLLYAMSLIKLKIALAAILLLGTIGVGVCSLTYAFDKPALSVAQPNASLLQQEAPEQEGVISAPENPSQNPKDWLDEKTWPALALQKSVKINPQDDELTKLHKERFNAAQREFREGYNYWLQGIGSLKDLSEMTRRLIFAREWVRNPRIDHVGLVKEKVAFAKYVEKQAEIKFGKQRQTTLLMDVNFARYFRLDSEIELIQAVQMDENVKKHTKEMNEKYPAK